MKVLRTIIAMKDGSSFSSGEEGLSQLLADCNTKDYDPSRLEELPIFKDYKTLALTSPNTLEISLEFPDVSSYLKDVQIRDEHIEKNGGMESFSDSIGWQFSEDVEPIDE